MKRIIINRNEGPLKGHYFTWGDEHWTPCVGQAAILSVPTGEEADEIMNGCDHLVAFADPDDWFDNLIMSKTTDKSKMLPTFLDELRERSPDSYRNLTKFNEELFNKADKLIPEVWCDTDHTWWEGPEANALFSDVCIQLNNICPRGIRFGPLKNEPTSYGFWIINPLRTVSSTE